MDVAAVVTAMRAFPRVLRAQQVGCELLFMYLDVDSAESGPGEDGNEEDDRGRWVFLERRGAVAAAAGAAEALAAALKLHSRDETLRRRALGVLARLADLTRTRAELIENPEILCAVFSAMGDISRRGTEGTASWGEEDDRALALSAGCRVITFAFDLEQHVNLGGGGLRGVYTSGRLSSCLDPPFAAATLAAVAALRWPGCHYELHPQALKAIITVQFCLTATTPRCFHRGEGCPVASNIERRLGLEAAREAARGLVAFLLRDDHRRCNNVIGWMEEDETTLDVHGEVPHPPCKQACFALESLCNSAPVRAAALEAGGVAACCAALRAHGGHAEIGSPRAPCFASAACWARPARGRRRRLGRCRRLRRLETLRSSGWSRRRWRAREAPNTC